MTTRHVMYLLACLMALLVASLWIVTWVSTRPQWYHWQYNTDQKTMECVSGLTHNPVHPFYCESLDPKPEVKDNMWFSDNQMIVPGFPWTPDRCEDGISELTRSAAVCKNVSTMQTVDDAQCLDPKPKSKHMCGTGFDNLCHWSSGWNKGFNISWDECVARNKFTYSTTAQTCVRTSSEQDQDIGLFANPGDCWQSVKDKVLVKRYVLMDTKNIDPQAEADRMCMDIVSGRTYVDMIQCRYEGALVW